ncbi:nephrin-like [Glandiceps talaboti]
MCYADLQMGPDVEVAVGDDAYLICNASSNYYPQYDDIRWKKGPGFQDADPVTRRFLRDHYPQEGYDRHEIILSGTLRINDTVTDDTDTYWCELYNIITYPPTYDFGSLRLNVIDRPRDARIGVPKWAWEGDPINITCWTPDTYGIQYRWYKDGYMIAPYDPHYETDPESPYLIISHSHRDDSGYYVCAVSNIAGTYFSDDGYLDIFFSPDSPWPTCYNISHRQSDDFLQTGDNFTIICEATDGNPSPFLKWYGDDGFLDDCARSTNPLYPHVTYTICSWLLHKSNNGQTYTCQGTQENTTDITLCYIDDVDVKYAPGVPECYHSSGLHYLEGEHATIECESVDGNPLATLQWVNGSSGDVIMVTDPPSSGEVVHSNYSWLITRTDNQLSFTCNASNLVQVDPLWCSTGVFEVDFAPMEASLEGYNGPIKSDEYLTLTCIIGSSNPPSSIIWYINGDELVDNEYEKIGEESFSDGNFHGTVTQQDLIINAQPTHNGASFMCQATVTDIGGPYSDIITTVVYCE